MTNALSYPEAMSGSLKEVGAQGNVRKAYTPLRIENNRPTKDMFVNNLSMNGIMQMRMKSIIAHITKQSNEAKLIYCRKVVDVWCEKYFTYRSKC